MAAAPLPTIASLLGHPQGVLLEKLAPPVTQAESHCRCLKDISGALLMDGI